MWDFIKRHKLAVFLTLGGAILLWIWYEYEKQAAANAQNNNQALNDASELTDASLPLLYASGGGLTGTGAYSGGTEGTSTATPTLGNYVGSPTGTSTTGTSQTSSSIANPNPSQTLSVTGTPSQSTSTSGEITSNPTGTPTPTGSGAPGLSPQCQYQLPGVTPEPGIAVCSASYEASQEQELQQQSSMAPSGSAFGSDYWSTQAQTIANSEAVTAAYYAAEGWNNAGAAAPAGSTSTGGTPAPSQSETPTAPAGGSPGVNFNSPNVNGTINASGLYRGPAAATNPPSTSGTATKLPSRFGTSGGLANNTVTPQPVTTPATSINSSSGSGTNPLTNTNRPIGIDRLGIK
jgi:hypothetical protein